MGKNKNIKMAVQYINITPGKKIVSRKEMSNYEFLHLSQIIDININPELAFDYLMMIAIDKMITNMPSIERVALIRSTQPKYSGFQLIIDGNITADKSLMPMYICWEKLENHQKSLDDLLPLYED